MSFNTSNLGAGTPGGGNDDAYEFDKADQSAVERQNATVPHVPPDSAEYLGGELPKYAESTDWTAGANAGESTINPNNLSNPMDPSAGLD
jgi:chitodextrinase